MLYQSKKKKKKKKKVNLSLSELKSSYNISAKIKNIPMRTSYVLNSFFFFSPLSLNTCLLYHNPRKIWRKKMLQQN